MGFGIGASGFGMGPRGALENFAGGEDERGKVFNRRFHTESVAREGE